MDVDRFGLPKDYATSEWLMYRKNIYEERWSDWGLQAMVVFGFFCLLVLALWEFRLR